MKNSNICHLMNNYKNVYWIGENKNSQRHVLYKYINVEYAIKFLETGILYLVEPILWPDPYESRFYTADYKNISNFSPTKLFCTCFTQQVSSEAAWKMYNITRNGIASRTIRFEFRRSSLLHTLDTQIAQDGKIYIGNAIYDYTTQKIDRLHLREENLYNHFFGNFSLEKFIYLLLLKRKAYTYEEEVRLFFVLNENNRSKIPSHSIEKNKFLLKIPKNKLNEIIKSITIDPQCSDLEYNMIKTAIEKLHPNCKCFKHNLYKNKSRIIIE